nr:hypothetical protein [uncultured Ruminococcus sp.]
MIPTEINEPAVDVDKDDCVTILDATWIRKWLEEMPSYENIGKPI